LLLHLEVVEVEVRLVAEEAVPVIRTGLIVPSPVRLLGIDKDDPRVRVLFGIVAPDVPESLRFPYSGRIEKKSLMS
jgi:hypothetical protein